MLLPVDFVLWISILHPTYVTQGRWKSQLLQSIRFLALPVDVWGKPNASNIGTDTRLNGKIATWLELHFYLDLWEELPALILTIQLLHISQSPWTTNTLSFPSPMSYANNSPAWKTLAPPLFSALPEWLSLNTADLQAIPVHQVGVNCHHCVFLHTINPIYSATSLRQVLF